MSQGETRSVTLLLSSERLIALRSKYDNDVLLDIARSNLERRYPPAGAFVDPLRDHFYKNAPYTTPKDRERVLLALLAAQMSNLELAVHFYWSLMEGLTVQEIAEVLLLVSAYAGTHTYNNAIALLERILLVLDGQSADELDTINCINAIMRAM